MFRRTRRLLYPYKYKRFGQSCFDADSQCLVVESYSSLGLLPTWQNFHIHRRQWIEGSSISNADPLLCVTQTVPREPLISTVSVQAPACHLAPFRMFGDYDAVAAFQNDIQEVLIYLRQADRSALIAPLYRISLDRLNIPNTDWYLNYITAFYCNISNCLFVAVDEYSHTENCRIAIFAWDKVAQRFVFRETISTFTEAEVASVFLLNRDGRDENGALMVLCKNPDSNTSVNGLVYDFTSRRWTPTSIKPDKDLFVCPNSLRICALPKFGFHDDSLRTSEFAAPRYSTGSQILSVPASGTGNSATLLAHWEPSRRSIFLWSLERDTCGEFSWKPLRVISGLSPPPTRISAFRSPSLAVSDAGEILIGWQSTAGPSVFSGGWTQVPSLQDLSWRSLLKSNPETLCNLMTTDSDDAEEDCKMDCSASSLREKGIPYSFVVTRMLE